MSRRTGIGAALITAVALSMIAAAPAPPPRDRKLVDAIIHVESRGDPEAVNAREDAVGVLQIRPVMVRDVNRIIGREEFTLADRLDEAQSRRMFWVYSNHYSPGAGRETLARRWNGGPRGDSKKSTLPYWRKVRAALE
jgi:soluble lytic murein transglycosylase-like protein